MGILANSAQVSYSWGTVSLGERVRTAEVPEDIELHDRLALRGRMASVPGIGRFHGRRDYSRSHRFERRHVRL